MKHVIVIALILITILFGVLIVNQNSNDIVKQKDIKNEVAGSNQKSEKTKLDTIATNGDTIWLNVSYLKLFPVSFSIAGKLKKGDVPFKSGEFVKENDFLVALDMSDYFRQLSKLKLSIRDELLDLIGANPKLQEPEAFIKWNQFLNDVDISKKLPEFPSIYNLEEDQIIRNSQIAGLYVTCRILEQNAQNFFYLSKNEGYIWEVKKKIGDEVKANESFLRMARLDDLVFSSNDENNPNLNEKKFSLFNEKNQKIGIVKLLNDRDFKFKLVKISNKSISIDPKGKFYILQQEF